MKIDAKYYRLKRKNFFSSKFECSTNLVPFFIISQHRGAGRSGLYPVSGSRCNTMFAASILVKQIITESCRRQICRLDIRSDHPALKFIHHLNPLSFLVCPVTQIMLLLLLFLFNYFQDQGAFFFIFSTTLILEINSSWFILVLRVLMGLL